jgi:hypothetical protein
MKGGILPFYKLYIFRKYFFFTCTLKKKTFWHKVKKDKMVPKCLCQTVCAKMTLPKCLWQNVCAKMSVPKCLCQNVFAKMSVSKCLCQNVCAKMYLAKISTAQTRVRLTWWNVYHFNTQINFSFNNLFKNLTEICLGRMLEGIQICHWHQSRWHKTCWERGRIKWWLQFKQQFWLQVRRSLWSHTWRPFQGKNLWLRGLLERLCPVQSYVIKSSP